MTMQEELVAAHLVSDSSVKTPPIGQGLLAAPEVGRITSVQGQSTPGKKTIGDISINDSPINSSKRLTQKK